jgi:hypothetical protein
VSAARGRAISRIRHLLISRGPLHAVEPQPSLLRLRALRRVAARLLGQEDQKRRHGVIGGTDEDLPRFV